MHYWKKLIFFLLTTQSFVYAKSSVLTILTFNDVYEIVADAQGRGGFAEMQALLLQERANSRHSITTVNGDFLSPCILSSLDKGAHRIALFNMMGVDMVVLGNHEFDFGPDEVLKRIRESKFPWLAANAIGLDGKPFTGEEQLFILDVDGIKVGFFGLLTVETPDLSSTEKKVCFAPLVYTAKQSIQELRSKGAEVIVALTHLLMAEDRQLAEEVPEIDVILGGHDHDPITWYDDKTFIHKSGQNAYYLTRLDLFLEKNDLTGRVRVLPSWNVILNRGFTKDPVVGQKVDELQKTFETITSEPLGIIKSPFDTLYSNVRSRETLVGNLISDALLSSCNADISIISGGIIRGNVSYREGDMLTLRNLLAELPFGNINVMVEVTGRSILEALENGVSQVEGKAGRFPQVSGMQFAYDASLPVGQRIREVFVGTRPLEMERLYKVATVDYMFNGGDGYGMFKNGKVLLSPLKKIDLVSTVANYIRARQIVDPCLEGRIQVWTPSLRLDEQFFSN